MCLYPNFIKLFSISSVVLMQLVSLTKKDSLRVSNRKVIQEAFNNMLFSIAKFHFQFIVLKAQCGKKWHKE